MSKKCRNFFSPYGSTSFKTYLSGSTLELVSCWKLVSVTGETIAATSHTKDLVLDGHPGVTFKSKLGSLPTASDSSVGSSTGLELDAVFDDDLLTKESVLSGVWDGAFLEIFIINYRSPKMGEYVMYGGFIGDVKILGNRFRAEGRPLTAKGTIQIGKLSTLKCIVRNLGDHECKVDLNAPAGGDGGNITVTGTVSTGASNTQFTDTSRSEVSNYFTHGIVTFTSGSLNGRSVEVRKFMSGGLFELLDATPLVIDAGVTYSAIRGCDRTPETCKNVFNNIINIRAQPKIPGLEKAYTVKPAVNR